MLLKNKAWHSENAMLLDRFFTNIRSFVSGDQVPVLIGHFALAYWETIRVISIIHRQVEV